VDLNTVNERSLAAGITPLPANEWWLGARSGATRAAAVLTAHPAWQAGVVDRTALRRQLRDAPLGAALQGALVLGFAAAVAFAVIGFVVNLSVSVRERRGEFAILRALGSKPGQLFGLLGVEQAILAGLGLAGGSALGLAAVMLVVPHIVLTVQAAAPFPAVEVIVPWPLVLGILGGIAALLYAALALVVRAQSRSGLGTATSLEQDR
jgi:predicted lysophospholipase L1 biosynthesis ABC-type transport system permease subunit